MKKPDPFDVALLGVILAFAVGVVYFFQLLSMRDSVEHSRKSMQIDQRAWLKPTIPNFFPLNGSTIPADVQITNIGKTVATNVVGKVVATVLKKGETPPFDDYRNCYLKLYAGALWPNEIPPLTAHLTISKCGGAKSVEPVVPDQELTRQINGKEAFIIFFGQLEYCDVFGVKHRTTFCNGSGEALSSDNIKQCINYNGADNNDQPDPNCRLSPPN